MVDVSVIVPAYNAQSHLDDCLTALENQSLARDLYEIIVVNDGSQDNTGAIANQFNVTVINQQNQGPAVARNEGV